jgi:hypothetical protein
MHLGWKVILPFALAYIVLMAASILTLDWVGIEYGLVYGLILTAVNLIATVLFLWVVDRDRIIGGTAPLRPGQAGATGLPAGITVEREPAASGAGREEESWR